MDAPLRADARRNRARVLEVAAEAFATEGLSVPVHEIARRAGVGTGTVGRHFPTKEALFEASMRHRVDELTARAAALEEQEGPGAAFSSFFTAVVRAGAADRGLAERLAAVAGDGAALDARVGADVLCEHLGRLLDRAQAAGAVRPDVTLADVEALMVAVMSRGGAPEALIAVVADGLRATRATTPA